MTPTSYVTQRKTESLSSPAIAPRNAQDDVAPQIEAQPRLATDTLDNRVSLAIKQALDFIVAGTLTLLASPVFLVVGVLIKATSPGPVFYVQRRVGANGKVFRFYKFRTMKHNNDDSAHREFSRNFIRGQAKSNGNGKSNGHLNGNGNGHAVLEESPVPAAKVNGNGHAKVNGHGASNGNGHRNGTAADAVGNGSQVYKITKDPRVTRIGHLLRRTSLDELPQLFNVLRGEMSMVGPRPPVVYELEHYQDWHKQRLAVKPGITGLWQVSGRSSVPFDEMVLLDLYYIENRSTTMDLRIMAKTLPVMVKGDGAY